MWVFVAPLVVALVIAAVAGVIADRHRAARRNVLLRPRTGEPEATLRYYGEVGDSHTG
jgi:hypothetical protein